MPLIQGCKKERSVYKTIYLPERLADAVDRIALRENVSFNRVIVCLVEFGVEAALATEDC